MNSTSLPVHIQSGHKWIGRSTSAMADHCSSALAVVGGPSLLRQQCKFNRLLAGNLQARYEWTFLNSSLAPLIFADRRDKFGKELDSVDGRTWILNCDNVFEERNNIQPLVPCPAQATVVDVVTVDINSGAFCDGFHRAGLLFGHEKTATWAVFSS